MTKTIIIIGIIIFLVLIFSYIQNKRWENQLQKINENRPNLTRAEYIDRLVKNGFDKKHVEVVHDEIKDFIAMDNFSMYPEDNIHKLYRIEDLDDVELIDGICKKLNIKKAEQKDLDLINKEFKQTTAEYILTLTKKLAE
jgi:hypothetical protein